MNKYLPLIFTIGFSFLLLSCNPTTITNSQDIKITPASPTMKTNSVQVLEVSVPKNVYSVTQWQSSCGYITGPSTARILYVAPSTPGSCSIEAKSTIAETTTVLSKSTVTVIAESIGWQNRLSSNKKNAYSVSGIVVDAAGNTFVSGSVTGFLEENTTGYADIYDVYLAKFDSFGNIAWLRQFGTSARDYGSDIAIDSGGNTYIYGFTINSAFEEIDEDLQGGFVAKYDTNGQLQWNRQVSSFTDVYEVGKIAIDIEGNIVITGQVRGTQWDEYDNPIDNSFVAKLDSEGNQLWFKPLERQGYKTLVALGTDSKGSIIVIGFMSGLSSSNDVFLVKYDSAGEELWFRQLDMNISNEDEVGGLAIMPDNSIIIAGNGYKTTEDWTNSLGSSYISKIGADGDEKWLRRYGMHAELEPKSVTVDDGGNIIVAGNANWQTWLNDEDIDESQDLVYGTYMTQFDMAGNMKAMRQFLPTSNAQGLIADNRGNIYISGNVRGAADSETRIFFKDVFVLKVTP